MTVDPAITPIPNDSDASGSLRRPAGHGHGHAWNAGANGFSAWTAWGLKVQMLASFHGKSQSEMADLERHPFRETKTEQIWKTILDVDS